jgi:formylglycine-generating enzyme required for sulfatase activity
MSITGLGSGTSYYFWVSTVKDGQESGKSPVVTVLTAAAVPVNPTPNVPSDMVRINGGSFMMGSPASEAGRQSNEVQHQVTVSGFYLGKYEVTQKEYQAVMGTNPSNRKGDNLPVERVTWYDAVNYCNARSRNEGLTPAYTVSGENVTWDRSTNGYRLPTEAEWEYACRAGTTTPYSSGSSVDGAAWYRSNSGSATHPVGTKQANAWGIYDMHGNVYEWCWDWYGDYSSGAQTDPMGASSGTTRVIRSMSWNDPGQYLRSAYRDYFSPSASYYTLGFRLLRPSL